MMTNLAAVVADVETTSRGVRLSSSASSSTTATKATTRSVVVTVVLIVLRIGIRSGSNHLSWWIPLLAFGISIRIVAALLVLLLIIL